MHRINVIIIMMVVVMCSGINLHAQHPGRNSFMFELEGGLSYSVLTGLGGAEQDVSDGLGWMVSYRNNTTGLTESYPVEFTYSTWRIGGTMKYFTGAATAIGLRYARESVRQTQTIEIQVDDEMSAGLMTYHTFAPVFAAYFPVSEALGCIEAAVLVGAGSITRIPNLAENDDSGNFLIDIYNKSSMVIVTGLELGIGFNRCFGSSMAGINVFYSAKFLTLEEEEFPLTAGGALVEYPEKDLMHQIGVRLNLSFYSSAK